MLKQCLLLANASTYWYQLHTATEEESSLFQMAPHGRNFEAMAKDLHRKMEAAATGQQDSVIRYYSVILTS